MDPSENRDLSGKVAVITGGASGIGLATARQLAARGVNLVLVDIEDDALEQAAQSLRSESTVRIDTRVCDVTDHAAMVALADDVVATCGGVHIVFNNAGIAVGGPIAEMTHEDWRWVIDVDLWGPIHGVEAFLPHLRSSGQGGHMLFTSSFAGLAPNVGLGAYCVAKYGVVALAEVLHKELRGEGIGVSVLCPMRVGTNIGASQRNRQTRYGAAAPPRQAEELDEASEELAGRVLDVNDVAAQVVDAIVRNRLYILPHEESRQYIRRRFDRIERAFEENRTG